jgi:hypothetical protein
MRRRLIFVDTVADPAQRVASLDGTRRLHANAGTFLTRHLSVTGGLSEEARFDI